MELSLKKDWRKDTVRKFELEKVQLSFLSFTTLNDQHSAHPFLQLYQMNHKINADPSHLQQQVLDTNIMILENWVN